MGILRRFIENTLWPRLEEPIVEIVVHLAVTFMSVLSIAIIELLLFVLHIEGKVIPGTASALHWLGLQTEVTLSDWMLALEVIAATAIIVVGIIKAVRALWRRRTSKISLNVLSWYRASGVQS